MYLPFTIFISDGIDMDCHLVHHRHFSFVELECGLMILNVCLFLLHTKKKQTRKKPQKHCYAYHQIAIMPQKKRFRKSHVSNCDMFGFACISKTSIHNNKWQYLNEKSNQAFSCIVINEILHIKSVMTCFFFLLP